MPTPLFTPGQRVTLQRETQNSKYHHVTVDEVVCDVIRWLPEFNLLEAHENSRFTFFRGYRDNGRSIGARNPYDDNGQWRENCFQPCGRNGYIIAPDHRSPDGEWTVVAQPVREKSDTLPADQLVPVNPDPQ